MLAKAPNRKTHNGARPRNDRMYWREGVSEKEIAKSQPICRVYFEPALRVIRKAENHGYGKRVVGIRVNDVDNSIELFMHDIHDERAKK
jgi:hypothetical protein